MEKSKIIRIFSLPEGSSMDEYRQDFRFAKELTNAGSAAITYLGYKEGSMLYNRLDIFGARASP